MPKAAETYFSFSLAYWFGSPNSMESTILNSSYFFGRFVNLISRRDKEAVMRLEAEASSVSVRVDYARGPHVPENTYIFR